MHRNTKYPLRARYVLWSCAAMDLALIFLSVLLGGIVAALTTLWTWRSMRSCPAEEERVSSSPSTRAQVIDTHVLSAGMHMPVCTRMMSYREGLTECLDVNYAGSRRPTYFSKLRITCAGVGSRFFVERTTLIPPFKIG